MEKYNESHEEMITTIASLFKTLPYDIKNQPLTRLNIDPAAADALSAVGIYTIGQLFGYKNAKYDNFIETGKTPEYESGDSAAETAYTSAYTSFEDTESVCGTKKEDVSSYPEKTDPVVKPCSPEVSDVIENTGFTSTLVGASETIRSTPEEREPTVKSPIRELPNGIRTKRYSGAAQDTAPEDQRRYDTSVSSDRIITDDLPESIKRMSVINLKINSRAVNALMRSKVARIGQLADMSREKLLSIRNLSEETAEEILREMALLSERKENYFNE